MSRYTPVNQVTTNESTQQYAFLQDDPPARRGVQSHIGTNNFTTLEHKQDTYDTKFDYRQRPNSKTRSSEKKQTH